MSPTDTSQQSLQECFDILVAIAAGWCEQATITSDFGRQGTKWITKIKRGEGTRHLTQPGFLKNKS